MPVPQAAADYYAAQQRLAAAVIANVRRLWQQVGLDLDAGWSQARPRLTALVSAGQYAAAQAVEPYLAEVLAETGQIDEAVTRIRPLSFVGVAGDGRPVETLLYGSVTTTKRSIATGATPAVARAAGSAWLDMAVQTVLADTGRAATGVGIAVRPTITGYVRMLNPPSCSRCTVLAGRWYRWNAGFARHPHCDCRHIPASENVAGDLTTSPLGYFESLSAAEQDRIFTVAGAQAIRDGADLGQVVNARRGMQRAVDGTASTTSGTSARSLAGRRMAANGDTVRLMPESIYEIAADRTEAIELLARFGFVS